VLQFDFALIWLLDNIVRYFSFVVNALKYLVLNEYVGRVDLYLSEEDVMLKEKDLCDDIWSRFFLYLAFMGLKGLQVQ
jgi:hypothetical protein